MVRKDKRAIRIFRRIAYLRPKRIAYELCVPTAGKRVPSGPDWLHEIKLHGYRMLVIRENDRVRLITKGGHDWTGRYPWIVESALKNRQKHFVIDGEAVVLGVDGNADFNDLHSTLSGSLRSSARRQRTTICWKVSKRLDFIEIAAFEKIISIAILENGECQRTVEIDASTEGVATELAKQWFLQGRTALRMVAACRPHSDQAR